MNNDPAVTAEVGQTDTLLSNIRQHWVWYVILGVLLMITGVVGATYSSSVTMIVLMWFGLLLLASGIFHLFYAFSTKTTSGLIANCLIAILCILLGGYMLLYPMSAGVFVTLLVGVFLISNGIFRIIYALSVREAAIWWIVLFTGLISILLGILILQHWPISGLWVIGLYISIEVFLSGISMFTLAIAARTQI